MAAWASTPIEPLRDRKDGLVVILRGFDAAAFRRFLDEVPGSPDIASEPRPAP